MIRYRDQIVKIRLLDDACSSKRADAVQYGALISKSGLPMVFGQGDQFDYRNRLHSDSMPLIFENMAQTGRNLRIGEIDALIRAKRLRHARFTTPDVDRQVDYYQHVIGLAVVAKDRDRAFLASQAGQLSLVFERGESAGLTALGLELSPDLALAEVRHALKAEGCPGELVSDPTPGDAQVLRLTDIEGRGLDLFSGPFFHDNRDPLPGVAPLKLGHVACYTRNPDAVSNYYGKLLGFRISDWIEDRFVFMRCGHEHHTVNFARGDVVRIHHLAFELHDAAHMHRACDILGSRKIPVLWGPVRHGPGHNVAIYHRDPDGHVVEMFYDLDHMTDEELGYYDPRPWHRDRPQRPKVWVGLPRDVWGSAPSPELPEFYRLRPPA